MSLRYQRREDVEHALTAIPREGVLVPLVLPDPLLLDEPRS